MEPIWQYIENCKKSLFRFEGLQDYSAEDSDKWVENFLTTGKLAEIPNDNNEWWRKMKQRNESGIVTQRVRLVTEPLTDYTKMELAYLKEAKRYSSDDIRIIKEEDFKEIAPSGFKDFWMIDDLHVFVMEYGPKGKYLGSKMVEEQEVGKYLDLKEKLLERSSRIEDIV
jgi:hypothetical protein